MEMSVAFATDHRSVADWPRSMVRGSAVKLLIRVVRAGGSGGGSTGLTGAAGAGVGAGAFFFPHPAGDKSSIEANTAAPSVLWLIFIYFANLLAYF
jgi:hypothetical protein